MPKVQKTNTIRRVIEPRHLEAVGVTDQTEMVVFEADNDYTAEVSEAAAEHLVQNDDFEYTANDNVGSSSSSVSDENADESESDAPDHPFA